MARPRRIPLTDTEIQTKPEPPLVAFTACTWEHVVISETPVLRFYDAAGKTLLVGLTIDAERIWRRFTRGNM